MLSRGVLRFTLVYLDDIKIGSFGRAYVGFGGGLVDGISRLRTFAVHAVFGLSEEWKVAVCIESNVLRIR